jgi:hypothetical protein
MKFRSPKVGEVNVYPYRQARGTVHYARGAESWARGPGQGWGSSRRVEEVIDNRIMRKLDETGFIDRAHAAQGVKP